MDIYSLLHKGDYHPNFCEDFLLIEELDNQFVVAAVMDGCSNGKESYFAATLMGKMLRKACKTATGEQEFELCETNSITLGKWLLHQLFTDLKSTREKLFLDRTELLATVILLVYNQATQEAFIISIGDGVIAIDGNINSIDQQNMPDYLAYHLNKSFEDWFAKQQHIFQVKRPESISISTDGVESFMTKKHHPAAINVPEYLLNDRTYAQHKNMLGKKVQVLYAEHNVSPKDDLGIVRIIF